MLKLGRVTKVKVLFLVLVFVFHFDLFKFSAAILEKGLLWPIGGAFIREERGGGGALIRRFTVVKYHESTRTHLNQFHKILSFVKANNIKVDLRECDWFGCGHCNEQT